MAYATIAQNEDLALANSPSPTLPELQHTSLSLAFDDLTTAIFGDGPRHSTEPAAKSGGILSSFSSSRHSYDLVEDDEYEAPQKTPTADKPMSDFMQLSKSPGEDLPVRTASVTRHTPLNHPTPDLQSLQGAYLRNVERLEDSAERLSMASSLEEELGRMKEDMRRSESTKRSSQKPDRKLSSTSISNSIIGVNAAARSGGYSPAAFITSPVGSLRSNYGNSSKRDNRMSKSSRFSNPPRSDFEHYRKPSDPHMTHSSLAQQTSIPPRRSVSDSVSDNYRPGTSGSNDTYQQAQELFNDFDGTHFSPVRNSTSSRRISLNHPPLARDSKSYKEAQPGEAMVYYPAPVPVMLNLPPRLSRGDWGLRDKKRLQALRAIEGEQQQRQSLAWVGDTESELSRPRPMSQLPPQLRASAFFDKPGTHQDVQLKNGSAVATLDSILDAAAFAPVSAFTDHPIVGHLGDEVYGAASRKSEKTTADKKKAKRRSSFANLLRRQSQNLDEDMEVGEDDPERIGEKSIVPDAEELADGEEVDEAAEEESDEDSDHQLGFRGAPTTLLAELQMRKQQQKLRNRTAANAFPGGMHSTLLELDAVTQLQQKSRKTKHVTLAWEDHDAAAKENFGDDDIPLGVLFPEKEHAQNVNRPLGLMEKKELEDNEPLSSRRARLLGVSQLPSQGSFVQIPTVEEPAPSLNVPILKTEEEIEENEGETLAQRAQRMKQQKHVQTSFAEDVAGPLGLKPEDIGTATTPDPEETLGQRRKRLREEALKSGEVAPGLKTRVSMADLLHQNPAGNRQALQSSSLVNNRDNVPLSQLYRAQSQINLGTGAFGTTQYAQQALPGYGYQTGAMPYSANGLANNGFAPYMNGMQGGNMMNAMNMGGVQMPNPYASGVGLGMPQYGISPMDPLGMGPPLNPQQRAKIDAWRQGIV